MARDDLDELFGEGGGTPSPRIVPALALSVIGVITAILGMACLSAPGGILVLLGLWWIERELDRVDNGYLSEEDRPRIESARRFVFLCLGVVILLFFAQAFLYCSGFYQNLGDQFFSALNAL